MSNTSFSQTSSFIAGRTILGTIVLTAIFVAAQSYAADSGLANLRSAAQKLSRDRNAKIDVVSNAYASVFAHPELSAADRALVMLDFASAHAQKSLIDTAKSIYEEVASMKADGVTPAMRVRALNAEADMLFRSNFSGAFANYFTDGIEAAEAIYRRVLASSDATAADKVTAIRNIANCRLEASRDTVAARKLLEDATKLPGLTSNELLDARINLADGLQRMCLSKEAIAAWNALIDDDSLPFGKRVGFAFKALDCIRSTEGDQVAITALKTGRYSKIITDKRSIANFLSECGDQAGCDANYQALFADKSISVKTLQFNLLNYANIVANRGFTEFSQIVTPLLADLIKQDPSQFNSVYTQLRHFRFRNTVAGKSAAYGVWLLNFAKSVPESMRPSAENLLDDAIVNGFNENALPFAQKILALPATAKLKSDTRIKASIIVAVFKAGDNAAKAVSAIKSAVDSDKTLDFKTKAEYYLFAAASALKLRHESAARAIYTEREKFIVPRSLRSIACPFIKDAPVEINEIVESDFYKRGAKGLLDRKYGDNLQFLIDTDAAITGRNVTDANGNFKPTEMFTFCDVSGVKVVFYAFTDKVKDFLDGFANIGGYEAYLTTDIDAPYHCFLIDVRPSGGDDSSFTTQYDNGTGFRGYVASKHNCSVTHIPRKDGIVTVLAVDWKAVFNDLPFNGKKWFFESIHWEQGGYSWGGSESVHNRSSFGTLLFEGLDKDALTAIKRRILSEARNSFNSAFSARSNGYGEIWLDPELGDRDFYKAAVKPVYTRLAEYASRIKRGMSDADVNDVYDNAAADMMNIDFVISKMRRDYLDAKRVSGE